MPKQGFLPGATVWTAPLAVALWCCATGAERPSAWKPAEASSAQRYNECLRSLGGDLATSAALAAAPKILSTAGRPGVAGLRWNVNLPYQEGAINLLVPSSKGRASCVEAPSYPICWSYPSSRQIVCNRAMGFALEPQANPPAPWDDGGKLYFWTVLGHELGHLELEGASKGTSHAVAEHVGLELRCFQPDTVRRSLERDCDEIGAAVACTMAKTLPARPAVSRALSMSTWFSMAFPTDDLCRGDSSYAPMAVRDTIFQRAIVECGAETGHADAGEMQLLLAILEADELLRRIQRSGWAASPKFHGRRLRSQRAVLGPSGVLLEVEHFDDERLSSRVTTEVSVIELKAAGSPRYFPPLVAYPGRAEVVALKSTANGFRVALDRSGVQRELVLLDVACAAQDNPPCQLAREEAIVWRGDGELIEAPSGWVVVETSVVSRAYEGHRANVRLFDGADALRAGRISVERAIVPEEARGVTAVGFTHAGRAVAAGYAPNLELVLLSLHSPVSWRITARPALPAGVVIRAIGEHAGSEFFFLDRIAKGELTRPFELWKCSPLDLAQDVPATKCTAYAPPEEMRFGLISRGSVSWHSQPKTLAFLGDGLISVHWAGWTWIQDTMTGEQTTIPATGIAGRSSSSWFTYRSGRIDEVAPVWTPARSTERQLAFTR